MCAKKIRFSELISSREVDGAAAESRDRSIREILSDERLTDEQVVRMLRAKMSWKDWLKYDFARYWYAVGVFSFDSFLVLSVAYTYHVADALGILLLSILFVAMCIGEFLLYRRIWPQGILTWK
jgi:hypothetical protein